MRLEAFENVPARGACASPLSAPPLQWLILCMLSNPYCLAVPLRNALSRSSGVLAIRGVVTGSPPKAEAASVHRIATIRRMASVRTCIPMYANKHVVALGMNRVADCGTALLACVLDSMPAVRHA